MTPASAVNLNPSLDLDFLSLGDRLRYLSRHRIYNRPNSGQQRVESFTGRIG
jgi:hypothetical protein